MTAISRRRASSNRPSRLDGTREHTPSPHRKSGWFTTPVRSAGVVLAFLVAGCSGGSSQSSDDAERYLSTQLESVANQVGATVSDVECETSGTDEWSCDAFNSLSSQQTYTVRYSGGRWSFSNDEN